MQIAIDEAGNSALLFEEAERDLVIRILLSLVTDEEDVKLNIQKAIHNLKYAGMEIPDNVRHIH